MSNHKHNYSQYSNKNNHTTQKQLDVVNTAIPEVTRTVDTMGHPDPVGEPGVMSMPGVELVKETVETKPMPTMVEGVVSGCAKLNVRAEANLFANVVYVLDVMSEIMIDVEKSDKDWFYICTATGVEGYCMRKYVEARL